MTQPMLPNPFGIATYEDLLAEAQHDTVISHELEKDKTQLTDVPHVITNLVFRPSEYGEVEYVSVEATTKDGRMVVYNDGSTGIRRQLVQYLIAKRQIIPHDGQTVPVGGELADLSIAAFEVPAESSGEITFDTDGNPTYLFPVRVHVPHGLRVSEYRERKTGQNTPAKTFYLA